MNRLTNLLLLAVSFLPAFTHRSLAGQLAQPAPVPELAVPLQIVPGASYDSAVATPDVILGFPLGSRAATPEEVNRTVHAWAGHPRVQIVEYARSWEGRPLHYVVVTSPENQRRLEAVKAGMARLADPRGLGDAEARRMISELPGVAWLAYSIHGNESSGSDASLAVLHHLIAGRDPEIAALLDELIVIVDPMMNPDGRGRFTQQAAQHRGVAPNFDDQSLLRGGSWPWGRGNHYFFDLNRDWTLGIHPETRGRIKALTEWRPLLVVDAHEMGSQDTFLFSPQREPRNPHTPQSRTRWSTLFAQEQAGAFDQRGWAYYTGEWNEGWYPGYTDAWVTFRGAVGILYEQASVGEDAVRRPGGALMTYRRAVSHQAVSSLTNLETLRRNRRELLADFLAERRLSISADGPYANRTFAILPTANRARLARFVDLMELQGFELYQVPRPFQADAVDSFGRSERRTVPAGTLLIPNRQPEAPLVATMLELDRQMPPEYVERERREILRTGSSTIYDLTSWSAPLLHGLETLTLSTSLPPGAERFSMSGFPPIVAAPDAVAWIVDGADDASVGVAARVLELGFEVRAASRPFTLDGRSYSAGSVMVTRFDNDAQWAEAVGALRQLATELDTVAVPVRSGRAQDGLPDLGGGHFQRLEAPRVALVGRGGTSIYDFGATWLLIDRELGIRHTHLDEAMLASNDLRRYNVLVLPDRWFGSLDKPQLDALARWVETGGTLIAVGGSAAQLAKEEGLSSVRLLPDILDKLDDYEAAVLREHAAATVATPASSVLWSHQAPTSVEFPWPAERPARPSKEELEQRDRWQQQFMPSGAILAARVDTEHWLTFGSTTTLPLLTGRQPVLMAASPVEAPIRFGALRAHASAGDTVARVGWSMVPAGREMDLRMSGLLWPEAAHRVANSAWVTRERKGRGQMILFASPPSFRASTPAAARVLFNALILGPGFGADATIVP